MTGWFEEYCAANTHTAFTADGWPVAESVPRKIADALGAALAPYDPPADLIEHAAAQIYAASEFGRFEERPGNLLASARRSEKELAEFQKLTAKLADLIDGMHGPAVTALSREGLIARDLLEPLQRAHEASSPARARLEGLPQKNPGAKPRVEPVEVTQASAAAFEQITGKRPTRIADEEGEYGDWIETLRVVFAALGIKASAKKQAQEFRTRIGKKQAD